MRCTAPAMSDNWRGSIWCGVIIHENPEFLVCCRGRHRRGSLSGSRVVLLLRFRWLCGCRVGDVKGWQDGMLAGLGWVVGGGLAGWSKRRMEYDDVANNQCGKIVDLAWKLGVWIR